VGGCPRLEFSGHRTGIWRSRPRSVRSVRGLLDILPLPAHCLLRRGDALVRPPEPARNTHGLLRIRIALTRRHLPNCQVGRWSAMWETERPHRFALIGVSVFVPPRAV